MVISQPAVVSVEFIGDRLLLTLASLPMPRRARTALRQRVARRSVGSRGSGRDSDTESDGWVGTRRAPWTAQPAPWTAQPAWAAARLDQAALATAETTPERSAGDDLHLAAGDARPSVLRRTTELPRPSRLLPVPLSRCQTATPLQAIMEDLMGGAGPLEPHQRRARIAVTCGVMLARQGRYEAAETAFADGCALDASLDVASWPTFWELPRGGQEAAIRAYEQAGRIREAATLDGLVRNVFSPRGVPPSGERSGSTHPDGGGLRGCTTRSRAIPCHGGREGDSQARIPLQREGRLAHRVGRDPAAQTTGSTLLQVYRLRTIRSMEAHTQLLSRRRRSVGSTEHRGRSAEPMPQAAPAARPWIEAATAATRPRLTA